MLDLPTDPVTTLGTITSTPAPSRGDTASFPPTTDTNSNNTDGTGANPSSSDRSWVAGAIVGSLAGLGLVLGLAVWRWRRNKPDKAANGTRPFDESFGKAQLHSDDMPKPIIPIAELHPDSLHEMEGSNSYIHRAEKPANEVAVGELSTTEVETEQGMSWRSGETRLDLGSRDL